MPIRLLTAALRLAHDPGPADRDLLTAFAASRDEAAFTELVRRHGGLVLAACRRVTGHAQDAEDAFQAAFLVLARRAGQVGRPEQLGNWLYGVAVRTALDARSARRRIREQPLAAAPEPADADRGPDPDLAGVMDEELARLPEKYRAAVVLCELEGVPRKDAAARLRIPEGTLSSRLAHARKILATRLARRGVMTPAGVLAAVGPTTGGVIVPGRLIDHTARAAARVTGGAVPPGLVSDRVSSLTDGVLKAMLVSKLRITAGAIALVVAAVGAAAVVGQQPRSSYFPAQSTDPFSAQQPQTAPPAKAAAEKIPSKGIEDEDVPYPTVPTPAVVRVEEGKLIVRQRSRGPITWGPATPVVAGQAPTPQKTGSQIVGRKYDPSDVLVFDMKGNRLAPKAWREKFQNDQHVLVSWGGVLPNPRELVLFKDDTLLVIIPGFPSPLNGQPAYVARTYYQPVTLGDGSIQYTPVTNYEPVTTEAGTNLLPPLGTDPNLMPPRYPGPVRAADAPTIPAPSRGTMPAPSTTPTAPRVEDLPVPQRNS
ncbi:MAG TPA: sigma-70 family RNA polymerase sigma factor [Urbifossiella sp.]|jgi:RNA polymerase sigma factor (sigma-70 family)|nr:sigma-70 family RNA polymerase sigma factor [Urbifossiella sp.]